MRINLGLHVVSGDLRGPKPGHLLRAHARRRPPFVVSLSSLLQWASVFYIIKAILAQAIFAQVPGDTFDQSNYFK